ncbi:carbon-nitrogen hydrolase [Cryphonectria parasitica EP155]|uniref:Carbon-nitrogen hydrolase n=1 Tax=Cryphonectria parasitica (strain ATCC 38755 / EP155) TaxID=660469 RepID=A0A9P4Y2F9_CRYP1|nr:carbon-nitrogen hydrolase [Cryphonectria parasitica EP155]KAF3765418.1 carbon-nitrogen hydrolase [Cryphonectria parasitica EP155]
MAPGSIRLATASPATQPTTAQTLAQIRHIAQRAASSHSADILLLPEAYIGGYPRGSAFGCVVGGRSAEGRDEFVRYFEAAVDLGDVVGDGGAGGGEAWVRRALPVDEVVVDGGDGEGGKSRRRRGGDGTREELEGIAAETGVFLVVGCIERAGGSLYCSAVYVCPKRGMIGKRRKVMPTGTERLIWAQGSPRTLQAVSTIIRGIRINMAAAICWENYMPLLRQTLYAQNVNLWLAPTADGRDAWLGLVRTIGIEGRCFVVSSNMCKRREEEEGGDGDDDDGEDVTPYGQEQGRRTRRRSVIDENGNEIVLCTKGDEGVNGTAEKTTTTTTTTRGEIKKNINNKKKTGEEAFISRGGSCITGPFGDVLAGPQWEDDEGIIWADVDFKDCIRGRLDLDAGGSYSRNDSFKLSVEGLDLHPLPYF